MKRLLLAALLLVPQLAWGQEASKCGPLENAAKNLAKDYGERKAFMFIAGDERPTPVMVFINPETGTLTMFLIKPDKEGRVIACEFLKGERWRTLKDAPVEEEGDPS